MHLTKKRELFPGLWPPSPGSFALPRLLLKRSVSPLTSSGILTWCPFAPERKLVEKKNLSLNTELTVRLGPTDPCSTAVHMEPFSTSAFKVLTWIIATTTKICTHGSFTLIHISGFKATMSPTYLSWHPWQISWQWSIGQVHFQGWLIRQVSCYTLLSGFQLPWPPSCCLDQPTPFVVSDNRFVWHLTSTFGSSHSASSAYQKWPTWPQLSMSNYS